MQCSSAIFTISKRIHVFCHTSALGVAWVVQVQAHFDAIQSQPFDPNINTKSRSKSTLWQRCVTGDNLHDRCRTAKEMSCNILPLFSMQFVSHVVCVQEFFVTFLKEKIDVFSQFQLFQGQLFKVLYLFIPTWMGWYHLAHLMYHKVPLALCTKPQWSLGEQKGRRDTQSLMCWWGADQRWVESPKKLTL